VVGFMAGAPLLVLALVADQLLGPIVSRSGSSNAYRVLARKPVHVPAEDRSMRG